METSLEALKYAEQSILRIRPLTSQERLLIRLVNNLMKHLERIVIKGELTKVELQNLCHNLTCTDRAEFQLGCIHYQQELFNIVGPEYEI